MVYLIDFQIPFALECIRQRQPSPQKESTFTLRGVGAEVSCVLGPEFDP